MHLMQLSIWWMNRWGIAGPTSSGLYYWPPNRIFNNPPRYMTVTHKHKNMTQTQSATFLDRKSECKYMRDYRSYGPWHNHKTLVLVKKQPWAVSWIGIAVFQLIVNHRHKLKFYVSWNSIFFSKHLKTKTTLKAYKTKQWTKFGTWISLTTPASSRQLNQTEIETISSNTSHH